jgi:hypothetical protein
MGRDLGSAGSGGGSGVRGDGHAVRIGGIAGVGRSPVERQQSIEHLDFSSSDPADDVGQVGYRIDAVQAAGFDQTDLAPVWRGKVTCWE